MKRLVVIAGLGTALTLAASAFASPQHAASCVAGVKKINGVNARTFCGPAKATVRVGGRTVVYKGGECSKSSFGWSINVGTAVLGSLTRKPEYFGLAASAKPGVQTKVTVAVVHSGKAFAVSAGTLSLKPGLKSGTFSGEVFGESTRLTGSFTC
jgi:hypothetical protein